MNIKSSKLCGTILWYLGVFSVRADMNELVSLINKNFIEYFTSPVFSAFNYLNSNSYHTINVKSSKLCGTILWYLEVFSMRENMNKLVSPINKSSIDYFISSVFRALIVTATQTLTIHECQEQ